MALKDAGARLDATLALPYPTPEHTNHPTGIDTIYIDRYGYGWAYPASISSSSPKLGEEKGEELTHTRFDTFTELLEK